MLIHELTREECRKVLEQTSLGRLACSRNDQPYIVPVYFYFERDYLYSFATLGRKIQWMRANPLVCVEVDDITDQFHWTTVVVLGRYEELDRAPAHEALRQRALELFQKRPGWWYPATGKTRSSEHPVPVVYRIRIDRLTGRRARRDRARPAQARVTTSQSKAPRWWSRVLEPVRTTK